MTINDDTLVQITEEHEALSAKCVVLYDALRHIQALVKKARLPQADTAEIVGKILDAAKRATDGCDNLTQAIFKKGLQLRDEEVVAWAAAAGGYRNLTPLVQLEYLAAIKRDSEAEGKRRMVAARKREDARHAREQRNGSAEAQADGATSAGEGRGVVRSTTPTLKLEN